MKQIVYMGTPDYAKVILEAILKSDDFEVTLVITQPDRPVGRHQELVPSAVKSLALEYGIEILQPVNLKDDTIVDAISNKKPDFIVVAAFGQLLPKKVLDIAPCINLHASLLPLYRGASPVQQSLLNSDKFTGITAMLMEEGLDSGPTLGYRYFSIPRDMLVDELMVQLSQDASLLIIDVLRDFDLIGPLPQTKAASSHCKKIKKNDGIVDFGNANEIYSKFKAYHGWPGLFLGGGLKILSIKLVDGRTVHNRGEILDIIGESIVVGCGRGSVTISSVQPPSKKPMSAKSYLIGRGLKIGDYIS
ncbi:MAG TPA: methionyl-tRNA formyltransferase [Epsilonproteobacteria bacterium]|nr:methionyl-tRNA formyltransferase [Campylobacterota bacterium]